VKRHTPHVVLRVALVAALFLPLGGCAVSLFSDTKMGDAEEERIGALEKRMDAVEKALPPR